MIHTYIHTHTTPHHTTPPPPVATVATKKTSVDTLKKYNTLRSYNIHKVVRFTFLFQSMDSKKLQNEKEIEKNSDALSSKLSPYLFNSSIDFLTLRLSHSFDFYGKLLALVDNSDSILFDDSEFRIVYFQKVAQDHLSVYHILDSFSNIIAVVRLKNFTLKKNKNVSSDLEFKGLFFTNYSEYLDYFLEKFYISKDSQKIIKRIDYAIDISGLKIEDLRPYRIIEKFKREKREDCF